jgi:hypothetical protein
MFAGAVGSEQRQSIRLLVCGDCDRARQADRHTLLPIDSNDLTPSHR